ncbi:hypothetical protein CIB48_g6465 [Xylaria polymorpha]|nr:hypothetical protein CIB48_g6465 [Xylaria polymorpha]
MAANIPPALKPAGITPFIVRATQLESAKPVISYWCYYWVVQQILSKQLHNTDGECLQFTTTVMDKLEEMKTDQAGNDAVLDDVAGQAYVEQFAQETFDRALRPLKANKVTQQTASTFEAAATFFQLVNIWGQPDPETQEKIKYAKWNAARILKAIKEGKDPNESNPKQEEPKPEETVSPLDPNDPEVQLISSSQPQPATVEDVPDDGGVSHVRESGYSLNTAAQVSAPNSPLPPTASVPDPVSPIAPPDVPAQEPGSYFPSVSLAAGQPPLICLLPQHLHRPFIPPQQHYTPTQAPPPPHNYHAPYTQPVVPKAVPAPPPPPAQQYGGNSGPAGSYNYDDMAIAQAQKHAKWAISALNFEDVPTAVRELQAALATLGSR